MGDCLKRIAVRNRIDHAREPAAVDLIERIPLPIAMLDRSGDPVVLNGRFNFEEVILHSPPVLEAMHDTGAGWKSLRIPHRTRGQVACRVKTVDLPTGSMLILDDAPDDGLLHRLAQLHTQVSSLQRLCSADALTGA
jgi:hypothetical protein